MKKKKKERTAGGDIKKSHKFDIQYFSGRFYGPRNVFGAVRRAFTSLLCQISSIRPQNTRLPSSFGRIKKEITYISNVKKRREMIYNLRAPDMKWLPSICRPTPLLIPESRSRLQPGSLA